MDISNVLFDFNYLSAHIRLITFIAIITYLLISNTHIKTLLDILYYPNVFVLIYSLLFTIGEAYQWSYFRGKNSFALENLVRLDVKILTLIILIFMINVKFNKIGILLMIIISYLYSLKYSNYNTVYNMNLYEYVSLLIISYLFCSIVS
jgi:hypothetical protein